MANLIPKSIWDELIKVAEEDGIISDDEKVLLENIKKNLEKYYASLKEEPKDDSEKLKVFEAQLDIMREAYDTAYLDNKISKDELELLKKLQKIVRKIIEDHEI